MAFDAIDLIPGVWKFNPGCPCCSPPSTPCTYHLLAITFGFCGYLGYSLDSIASYSYFDRATHSGLPWPGNPNPYANAFYGGSGLTINFSINGSGVGDLLVGDPSGNLPVGIIYTDFPLNSSCQADIDGQCTTYCQTNVTNSYDCCRIQSNYSAGIGHLCGVYEIRTFDRSLLLPSGNTIRITAPPFSSFIPAPGLYISHLNWKAEYYIYTPASGTYPASGYWSCSRYPASECTYLFFDPLYTSIYCDIGYSGIDATIDFYESIN